MFIAKKPGMGRFSVEVELTNNGDLDNAKTGYISLSDVRRVRVSGIVDSGATRLVIPEKIARRLGRELAGTAKVRYADERLAERPIARNISLSYGGRESVFSAIVEPARESVMIGAIVLEELDFLIDWERRELVPRDPDRIVSEAECLSNCLV